MAFVPEIWFIPSKIKSATGVLWQEQTLDMKSLEQAVEEKW